ncbi:MAG: hypothetical protein KGQ93_02145 [Cyanobacteria bacterium REEB459]|nr:hypothetical protein [Cyanobacteria bacterium REEB459]
MTSNRDGYILIVDPEYQEIQVNHCIETNIDYPVFVANSTEQAIGRLHQGLPWLVILVINNVQDWSQLWIQQLRQIQSAADMTIVALADSTSPQWKYWQDNPDLDGFLVKPLSLDIVKSLVASAVARQVGTAV